VSSATPHPTPTGTAGTARFGWLDLLRGYAALVVTLHHATYYFVPRTRAALMVDWFDPGRYGVLVFFLVSGYIVPVSLERHGQIRRFWINRLLRIYPLLAVACLITLLPFVLGVRGLRAGLEEYDPGTAVLAHLTMLQDVLGVPSVINVLWTLSYEMAFYLLIVALFVIGKHRRSAPIAVTLVVAAVTIGGLVPTAVLGRALGTGPVVALTALGFTAAIAAAVSGRPALQTAGGLTGGILAVVLATANSRIGPWEGLVILAVMFTGTVLYRAEHGQIAGRTAVLSTTLVLVGAVLAGVLNAHRSFPEDQVRSFQIYWSGSVLLAAVTFAAGWAVRRRRIPSWLTGLGTISFSLYLMHPVLLMLNDQFFGTPDHDDALRLLLFVVVLLGASRLTYRYIEAPFQRLGRRPIRRSTSPPGVPEVALMTTAEWVGRSGREQRRNG
jgi:peptidoglycan/LPS O-acetylase OafA/YrhL